MKKTFIQITSFLCLVLFASGAFAADTDTNTKARMFIPSVSVGYAFSAQQDFVFEGVNGVSLLGTNKVVNRIPSLSGMYVAADCLFNFGDRLGLSVGARYAFPLGTLNTHEEYNGNSVLGRDWDSDQRDWVSGDILLNYALLKNISFVKDLTISVGGRVDYQNIKFKNPTNALGVLTSMADTVSYEILTCSPVFGISSTLKGFRAGIFGGDIKLSVQGSPMVYTSLKYTEIFGATNSLNVDDNFSRASFVNAAADVSVISTKLGSKADLSVSIFGQYTQFSMEDRIKMTSTPPSNEFEYKFSGAPNLAVVGGKIAIAF